MQLCVHAGLHGCGAVDGCAWEMGGRGGCVCTEGTLATCGRIKMRASRHAHAHQVPSEEAVVEIRERYLDLNWHAKSYTWKALVKVDDKGTFEFKELDMNKVRPARMRPARVGPAGLVAPFCKVDARPCGGTGSDGGP